MRPLSLVREIEARRKAFPGQIRRPRNDGIARQATHGGSTQEVSIKGSLDDERRLEALIVALGQAVDAAQARAALRGS